MFAINNAPSDPYEPVLLFEQLHQRLIRQKKKKMKFQFAHSSPFLISREITMKWNRFLNIYTSAPATARSNKTIPTAIRPHPHPGRCLPKKTPINRGKASGHERRVIASVRPLVSGDLFLFFVCVSVMWKCVPLCLVVFCFNKQNIFLMRRHKRGKQLTPQ